MAMIAKLAALLLLLLSSCGDDNRVRSLIEAAAYGDVDRMSVLIDGGANVNGVALDGWSALPRAAYAGKLEAVRLLLTRGAHINSDGLTPLVWAALGGHLEVAKFLVQSGGRLNLDPVAKANFLERVRSYKNAELISLVDEALSREKS